jgi:DNA mismatch repair protein MutL
MVAQPYLKSAAGYFSALAIIGQYNAAYIICQDGVDLLLIDQHAAHERVAFERLKAQFAAQGVESQGLLFPDPLELSFREAAAAKENLAELERCGFVLEDFGGNTWLLKGVPRLLAGADYRGTLRNIIEELLALGKNRVFTNIVEEVLTRIACHSVVRGSHPLTDLEIRALFTQMDATDFSSNCPHGRPVYHRLTLVEVERLFRRG